MAGTYILPQPECSDQPYIKVYLGKTPTCCYSQSTDISLALWCI